MYAKILRSALLVTAAFLSGVGPLFGECARTLPNTPFDPQMLSEHVRVLASDEFEGRAPASAGEAKTLAYLSEQFARLQLQPAGDKGGWTQAVPLRKIEPAQTPALRITAGGATYNLKYGDEAVFTSLADKTDVQVRAAPMVFVGYGVTAPEISWDDFKGVDLRGKVAVFLINDPDFEAAVPDKFGGKAMTYYGRWTYKFEEAARRGAIAALIVHEDAPAAYGWTTVQNSWGIPRFDIARTGAQAPQTVLQGWLRRDTAVHLFQQSKLDFNELKQRAMRPDFVPVELTGASFSAQAQWRITPVLSHNVVAKLPGRSRADENIIYSAHWDHLGVGAPDSTGDRIYHGAVDNATGVGALLELARVFASAPPTARSIYFVAFTAEEQGLLGAEYYTLYPPSPLASTAAILNVDILGTDGPACDLSIRGMANSTLHNTVAALARAQGRAVTPDAHLEAGYFYRADHFPFAKMGVPAITLMPGQDLYGGGVAAGLKAYEDYLSRRYHQPADRWSPDWDLRGAALDLDVLYKAGREIADSKAWPQWNEGSEFKRIRAQTIK